MDKELRSKYADYIAGALRYAMKNTKKQWPEDAIIVTQSYSELAELDTLLGMRVYHMDMPSSYDFFVAFMSDNVNSFVLQKYFLEYIEMYGLEDEHL